MEYSYNTQKEPYEKRVIIMREEKFTLNALLLVVMIMSAIFFFFTVKMTSLADRSAYSSYNAIEGTPYAVSYSSLKPDGIYEGGKTTGVLRLEGQFGYDWGAAAVDGALFLNEYRSSPLGLSTCQVVRVDTSDFSKQLLLPDAILRGRCASGEIVCLRGALLPSNYPKSNPLCRLYATGVSLQPDSDRAEVLFLDPDSGEILYSVWDEEALGSGFDARYLARTLREVMG